ncbi:uncharacterized protein [Bos indicus]|uniref:Uncharacterized protein isoform X3 n=1 Tax=Bos indicus TaxID=9915 RepID=A0ABM4RGK9_BOSIN
MTLPATGGITETCLSAVASASSVCSWGFPSHMTLHPFQTGLSVDELLPQRKEGFPQALGEPVRPRGCRAAGDGAPWMCGEAPKGPSPTNTRLETPWPGFSGSAVLRGAVFRMGTHQGDGKWNLPSYVQGPLWMWYPGPATVMRIPGCPRLPPAFTRRLWSFRTA